MGQNNRIKRSLLLPLPLINPSPPPQLLSQQLTHHYQRLNYQHSHQHQQHSIHRRQISTGSIPEGSFTVTDTVQIEASKSRMNVQLGCLAKVYMERLKQSKRVPLLKDGSYKRTDCIVPKSKRLTVIATTSKEAIKLTVACKSNCLTSKGNKGKVRYKFNCKTGEFESFGFNFKYICKFTDGGIVHCLDAKTSDGKSVILATIAKQQFLFLSPEIINHGAPKVMTFQLIMELDDGQSIKVDDVNRYKYEVTLQVIPYEINKRCEMIPQSGFAEVTQYKLYCQHLDAYSIKGTFFYSIALKSSSFNTYLKRGERLKNALKVNFISRYTPNHKVKLLLYLYSIENGKTCLETLSIFTYIVKPVVSVETFIEEINNMDMSKHGVINKFTSLCSRVNDHSSKFNKAYSIYTDDEKYTGVKNLIDLRLRLLKKVTELPTNTLISEQFSVLEKIINNGQEINATGRLLYSDLYSNLAKEFQKEASSLSAEKLNQQVTFFVENLSLVIGTYTVKPKLKLTEDEVKENRKLLIESVNRLLAASNVISTIVGTDNRSLIARSFRGPNYMLTLKVSSNKSSNDICDKPINSYVRDNRTDIIFQCKPLNNTSGEKIEILSLFAINYDPYVMAQSHKPNYPVLFVNSFSLDAYKSGRAHSVEIGKTHVHFLRTIDEQKHVQWKKTYLRFNLRRKGNFLYSEYSRNFYIPMVALKMPNNFMNHYISINFERRNELLFDVSVHQVNWFAKKQILLGDFEKIKSSLITGNNTSMIRIHNVGFVNYTVFVPTGAVSCKDCIYFVMVRPLEKYSMHSITKGRPRLLGRLGIKEDIKGRRLFSAEGEMEEIGEGSVIQKKIPLLIRLVSKTCLQWDSNKSQWSNEHCKLVYDPNDTDKVVQCSCKPGDGLISASIFIPPNVIHPINDAYLFMDFFTNPIMLWALLCSWAIYFGLLHLTQRLDKLDVEAASVTVLSNSLTGYIYLVCVKTNWWAGGGTTARVYLVMSSVNGSHTTVVHLRNSNRRCFWSGQADWFLLTTERCIGDLSHIRIWHDESGPAPDWDLDYVTIQDLQTRKLWVFINYDWLSTTKGHLLSTYVQLKPLDNKKNLLNRRKIFRIEVIESLRTSHEWFSFITTPPTPSFTRAQRLTCSFSLLLSLMLSNIMFHGIPTDDPSKQLRIGMFKISVTAVIISIQTSLIIAPIGFIFTEMFIQVKPKRYSKFSIYGGKESKETSKKTVDDDEYVNKDKAKKTENNEKKKNSKETNDDKEKEAIRLGTPRRDGDEADISKSGRWKKKGIGNSGRGGDTEVNSYRERINCSYSFRVYHRPRLNKESYSILTKIITDSAFFDPEDPRRKKTIMTEMKTKTIKLREQHDGDKYGDHNNDDGAVREGGKVKGKGEEHPGSKPSSNTKHSSFLLPWWFLYVSWTVVLSWCLVCSYLMMLYGFKYGYDMSLDWIMSFILGIVQSTVFEQPIQIVIISVFKLIIKLRVPTDAYHLAELNENRASYLANIHNTCYYEGNTMFITKLPNSLQQRQRKKTVQGSMRNKTKKSKTYE